MALLTAQGISQVAIALLRRSIVLPRTVTPIPGSEFSGSNGDTITVRVPQPGAAREQTTPSTEITYDDIDEIPVEVTLAHLYHAKLISDEEANLELEDFARQILRVQVDAVAREAEDELADVMNALDVDATIEFANVADPDDTLATILAAREALGENDAPPDDRWAAVSPQIATRILSIPNLTRVSEAGSSDALRDATIGRIFGFTFVESNALEDDTALFYHRSGFCFANRVPVAPRSNTAQSAAASEGGIGMRSILQYETRYLSEASVLSTFAGAAAVYEGESSPPTPVRFVKVGVAT
jgi:hypothetical protein